MFKCSTFNDANTLTTDFVAHNPYLCSENYKNNVRKVRLMDYLCKPKN